MILPLNNIMNGEKKIMNKREAIAKLQKLFMELESVNEQIKELKSELKESGFNVGVLAIVAKAMAVGKGTELLEKSEETVETINEIRE